MNIYGVVSIDTECDRGAKWRNILPIRYSAVTELIPKVFQKIFGAHQVKPTYLLSPEILENNPCVETLLALKNVELGSHLHGEFVGPGKKPLGEFTGEIQGQYPAYLEALKLANLTRLFEQRIGYKPTSFRAGRWGISPHTVGILENLGYLVDSSVTPYFIWKFLNYTLDYKICLDHPYFPSRENFLKQGQGRLLEVPVTIFSHYGRWINRHGFKALSHLPLWRPLWLRPTHSDFAQMKKIIDRHIASQENEHSVVLNMMFHNVEILPDENPYQFDQKRINAFLDDMERTFEYMHELGTKFVGLSDLYPIFRN